MRLHTLAVPIFAALVALVAVDTVSGFELYRASQARAAIKRDEATIHGLDYGILSVDAWMGHLRRMIVHGVDHFHLSAEERAALQAEIQSAMTELVANLRQRQPDSLKGKLGKAALGLLDPKSEAPALTETLLKESAKPETRARVKTILIHKLDEYAAESHDRDQDRAARAAVFARHHVTSVREFDRLAARRTHDLARRANIFTAVMVGSMILMLLAWLLVHRRSSLKPLRRSLFAVALALGLVALLAALASPMIEVDARIRCLDFVLLGQHLRFADQVLFYQSKSIMQVVGTLFGTHQADSMFVAVLILAFSIVLPMAKLICTGLALLGTEAMRKSRVLNVVAFKTSKWSMADVLVVAIFMAYVGFKAIIDSQLAGMNVHTAAMSSITTDKTSLQPAYILFVGFVLYGLVLAELIKRATKKDAV